jgi:hypothetical protein
MEALAADDERLPVEDAKGRVVVAGRPQHPSRNERDCEQQHHGIFTGRRPEPAPRMSRV